MPTKKNTVNHCSDVCMYSLVYFLILTKMKTSIAVHGKTELLLYSNLDNSFSTGFNQRV